MDPATISRLLALPAPFSAFFRAIARPLVSSARISIPGHDITQKPWMEASLDLQAPFKV
jgi:hypothetical protein